jgi:aromatic-L-amino-acid decarboxylase
MFKNDNLEIKDFDKYLVKICDMISKYQEDLINDPVVPQISYDDLYKTIDNKFPIEETNIDQVLKDIKETIIPNSSKVGHPRFLAWMNNSSSEAGVLGEILNIGLSQVPFTFKGGPAVTVLEEIVIKWFGQMFGYSENHSGTLVSGGTVANLTALVVARETKIDNSMKNGIQNLNKPLVLYMSDQGHISIERSVGILGIGINNIRKIPTDSSYRIQIDYLKKQIKKDIDDGFQPFCVIAQAGAANSGAIDPILDISKICKELNLWLHVDAAYGGGVILTKEGKNLLKGIENADSITTDPHKWFYMPVESGLILIKNKEHLYKTFSGSSCKAYSGSLDEKNYLNYGIQIARMSRSLKIWFAFRVYGINRLGKSIEHNLFLAQEFKKKLESSKNWEILNPVDLSIICFRYKPDSNMSSEILDKIQKKIIDKIEEEGKALLTPVVLQGKVGIRICFANHRTTMDDIEILYEALNRIGKNISN